MNTSSTYSLVKGLYHGCLPARARERILALTPTPLLRLRARAVLWLSRGVNHQDIYDESYYREVVEPAMARSAEVIAQCIIVEFTPRLLVDVGCGTGALLAAVQHLGVATLGLEYAQAGLNACSARGVFARSFDVERDEAPSDLVDKVDVVVSTEVAEHLPATAADRFVDLLCRLGPIVVFTAAVPGQGGSDHVNEQPHGYWIQKFGGRGFVLDEAVTVRWRTAWREAGVNGCFAANLLVFKRGPCNGH